MLVSKWFKGPVSETQQLNHVAQKLAQSGKVIGSFAFGLLEFQDMDAHILRVAMKAGETWISSFCPLRHLFIFTWLSFLPLGVFSKCFVLHKEALAVSFGRCELVWTVQRSKENTFPFILLCIDFLDLGVFHILFLLVSHPHKILITGQSTICYEILRAC